MSYDKDQRLHKTAGYPNSYAITLSLGLPKLMPLRSRKTGQTRQWKLPAFDGKVYGHPNEIDLYALNYNKKLFGAVGIKEPPRTWGELLSDGDRRGRSPFQVWNPIASAQETAVKISFLTHWPPETVAKLDQAAKAYTKNHPGTSIQIRAVPFADLLTTLRSQAGGSNAPTIASIYCLWVSSSA